MASIETKTTKKGERRYVVRYRAGGRTAQEWYRTLEQARVRKAALEVESASGVLVDPRAGARSLDDYFATWLESRLVRGRPLSPATRVGYLRLYRRNIAPDLGPRQVRSLRPENIRRWHGQLASAAGHDQAAKSYRLLRAVLATAEADEVIRQNPCRIRGGGEERPAERPMVPTPLVLDLADRIDPRYRAAVLLAGFAGLRTGETLGLRRQDVDLLRGEVHVVQQAQEVTGAGRVTMPPKSEAGRRVVALPRVVVQSLDDHLARYTGFEADSPVFTGPQGTPLRRATYSGAWRRAVRAAGAPAGLRPHDLRHHAATLTARMPGVTTKELMARIGHASPRAALIYQHATAERDRAIASYLDGVLAATEPAPLAPVVGLESASRGAGVGLGG